MQGHVSREWGSRVFSFLFKNWRAISLRELIIIVVEKSVSTLKSSRSRQLHNFFNDPSSIFQDDFTKFFNIFISLGRGRSIRAKLVINLNFTSFEMGKPLKDVSFLSSIIFEANFLHLKSFCVNFSWIGVRENQPFQKQQTKTKENYINLQNLFLRRPLTYWVLMGGPSIGTFLNFVVWQHQTSYRPEILTVY